MNKKATFLIVISAVFILFAFVGSADARYRSSVTVSQPIDYAKTVGDISLYEPSRIKGYDETDNSFTMGADNTVYDNIRFAATNTRTVSISGAEKVYANEIPTAYYIRIAQSDSTDETSVDYTVYEYDSADPDNTAYPVDEQTGYCGPFVLPSGATEYDFRFSVKVEWHGDGKGLGVRNMKVQMVKKRADDSFKVICETDLNLKVGVTINYYPLGSTEILSSQLLMLEKGSAINFLDTVSMNGLGIELPSDYYFSAEDGGDPEAPVLISYATGGALGWNGRYKFEITDDFAEHAIEVYLVHVDKIPVTFNYRDRSQPIDENGVSVSKIIGSKLIQIDKGTTIDFKGTAALSSMGISLPNGYKYIAAHFDVIPVAAGVNYYRDNYTIPADADFKNMTVDVYVAPAERRSVSSALSYYDSVNKKTVDIGEVLIEFDSEGSVVFGTEALKALHSSFASFTSFEIGVKNTETGATCQIGNPVNDGDITVNYFTIYQYSDSIQYQLGYCLANPKMCLYIQAWW